MEPSVPDSADDRSILLDEDPSDPAIFTRPGCVTGVFQRGVPVVPHARLADSAGQQDNVRYPIGLPKIYRLQGILRFCTAGRALSAGRPAPEIPTRERTTWQVSLGLMRSAGAPVRPA